MKLSISFKTLLVAVALLAATSAAAAVKADYQVVPLPKEIKSGKGKPFVLSDRTVIYAGSPELSKEAAMLAGYLQSATGFNLRVVNDRPSADGIIISVAKDTDNPEAYSLKVDSRQISIEGGSAAGCFYGIQTLRKSIPAVSGSAVEFAPVVINDSPAFAYRGVHLDVARHFFPADSVKKYIDMMALHNMNRLHWHLSDDQGWRMPLKSHPELVMKGSVRLGTCVGKNFSTCDSVPYGGFYTRSEVDDIIRYAAERHITIIPEIDLPGHMLAALTANPSLGCTGGPYELWTRWGISDDVLCAGNDDVYRFIDDVLTEMAAVFPSEYIHVGGDECPKDRWKECPKCQAMIAHLGLQDDDESSKEDKLQSHVMNFAVQVLARNGKKMIGWDEILEGGAPDDAVVMSWRGASGGKKAASMGHDVIMTPNNYYYLDYYQSQDRDNEPLAIGGYVPLSKCYSFNPYEDLTDADRHHILGVQANLWTEYIHDFPHIQYMALPRWAALSEVQWADATTRDFPSFLERLERLTAHYRASGFRYSSRRE